MVFSLKYGCWLLGVGMVLWLARPLAAQETPPPRAAAAADAFAVPDGTPDELLNYIAILEHQRPTAETPQALAEFRTKLFHALWKATAKILAGRPNTAQLQDAVRYQLIALQALDRMGDAKAGKALAAFPTAALEKAGLADLVRMVHVVQLQAPLHRKASREEFAKALRGIEKFLRETPLDEDAARLATDTVTALEECDYADLAVRTCLDFSKLFAASQDEELATLGATFEGAARRLGLVGRGIVLTGSTPDGALLNWKKYKGKVVLIDFWTTWCGPCREELANIEKNYAAYHSRGFDVVSVSLDKDREALTQFLEEHKEPWTVLLDDYDARGTSKSLSTYYGIIGIPAVILVGADGKVVSLRSRGEQLGKDLERLLGPAAPQAERRRRG
jgi:thiol-disulfide isomerase/thioredoxin